MKIEIDKVPIGSKLKLSKNSKKLWKKEPAVLIEGEWTGFIVTTEQSDIWLRVEIISKYIPKGKIVYTEEFENDQK